MTFVPYTILAVGGLIALLFAVCGSRMLLKTSKDVRVSLSAVNPITSRFQFQVYNRKSHPVMVREIGFYFSGQSPQYRRIHCDVEGQFRGASVEPKGEESWTLSCRCLRHKDFSGKGAGYVRLENGKRIKGEVMDLAPYQVKVESCEE